MDTLICFQANRKNRKKVGVKVATLNGKKCIVSIQTKKNQTIKNLHFFVVPIIYLKGTVYSSNILAKSLSNGSLMIVLQSRFSPNIPVGPAIFKLVFYRSIIFGSIIITLGSIVIIFVSIAIIFKTIDPKIMPIQDTNSKIIGTNGIFGEN